MQARGQTQWGSEGWGTQNFALFFHSPATKFVPSGCLLGILVVFEAPGACFGWLSCAMKLVSNFVHFVSS